MSSTRMKMYPYMVQEAIEEELLLEGTRVPAKAFNIAEGIASGKFTPTPLYFVHGT